MKLIRNMQVPTGNICVGEGEKGKLEFLSIGDYGKDANIKADFLGITRELNGVPSGEIMPLSEKWVITISTQYGCSMGCKFCDVPLVGKGVNATLNDMVDEVELALQLHPEIKHTKRLNVHYARMGEPTFNYAVCSHAINLKQYINPYIGDSLVHPVISTMLPRVNRYLLDFLIYWCNIKNIIYDGDAGLQFSINSTSNKQRDEMFSGNSLSLEDISDMARKLPDPVGRKYTLNFALADNYEVDAFRLSNLFDSSRFMCKLTPIHKTRSSEENNIETAWGYEEYTPYQKVEEDLINAGFDVIVFVPSYDEDDGLITCGNAILSGNNPKTKYTELI